MNLQITEEELQQRIDDVSLDGMELIIQRCERRDAYVITIIDTCSPFYSRDLCNTLTPERLDTIIEYAKVYFKRKRKQEE